MLPAPKLELPQKPNFTVIDGKTYLLETVSRSPKDMLRSIEAYYAQSIAALKEQVKRYVSTENLADLEAQIVRVEKHLRSDVIKLPENLRSSGTVLFLDHNKVYETRIVLFKPTRISCTVQKLEELKRWIEGELPIREKERFTKFLEAAAHIFTLVPAGGRASRKVDITINQDLVVEAYVVSYVPEEHLIYVVPKATHPHAHTHDGNLCTGNSTSENFWRDPQFEANFNSINPHSFANSSGPAGQKYRWMLKNAYFVSIELRTAEGPWTV